MVNVEHYNHSSSILTLNRNDIHCCCEKTTAMGLDSERISTIVFNRYDTIPACFSNSIVL